MCFKAARKDMLLEPKDGMAVAICWEDTFKFCIINWQEVLGYHYNMQI